MAENKVDKDKVQVPAEQPEAQPQALVNYDFGGRQRPAYDAELFIAWVTGMHQRGVSPSDILLEEYKLFANTPTPEAKP